MEAFKDDIDFDKTWLTGFILNILSIPVNSGFD